jgi:Mrp family chromosome partitioning ATPase
MMGAVFGGFFCLGLGVAAIMEFVLDRTIKRSADVRRHMRLPCFLAIPNTCQDGGRRRLGRRCEPAVVDPAKGAANSAQATNLAPWDASHHLRLYVEGLRERLITYFEINNLSHTPKLVGMAGCNEGAGVSTLVSSLAAALSKIGNGNVLVVDMSIGKGEAQSFHGGKPGCALANVADAESQVNGHLMENLNIASSRANVNDKLDRVMPTAFTGLVTKLKASDYDYIVFDLPPVTPLSFTPRLASYMDMVLLVVESEKTRQQAACQASELMRETRANVSVVLNKCRQRVPSLLSQEL